MNQSLLNKYLLACTIIRAQSKQKKKKTASMSHIVGLVQLPKNKTYRFIGEKIHEN